MLAKNIQQSGRSMIEMLGVLAIVGILSAGGIAGYSMAMQNHKTNQFIGKVHLIARQTQILYNGNYKVTGNTTHAQQLIAAGLITDYKSPFGGSLPVGTNDNGSAFFIQPTVNIPADSCVKVLTTDWGSKGTLFWAISVDGQFTDIPPLAPSVASSLCAGGNKKIRWWFK